MVHELQILAMDFYAEFFGPKDCDPAIMDQLLKGLPKLKPEDRRKKNYKILSKCLECCCEK